MKELHTTLNHWTNGAGFTCNETIDVETVADDFTLADGEHLDESYLAGGDDDVLVQHMLYNADGELEESTEYWIND